MLQGVPPIKCDNILRLTRNTEYSSLPSLQLDQPNSGHDVSALDSFCVEGPAERRKCVCTETAAVRT